MRTPDWDRTSDLQVRNLALYSAELRGRGYVRGREWNPLSARQPVQQARLSRRRLPLWDDHEESNARDALPGLVFKTSCPPLGASFQESGWPDSNRRPPRPERGALTKLRYNPLIGTGGFEQRPPRPDTAPPAGFEPAASTFVASRAFRLRHGGLRTAGWSRTTCLRCIRATPLPRGPQRYGGECRS
jgi:hypothetical protein